ncbi:MAG: hypothetical protein Q7R72_00045 [bacterium]|nr:hypothetical protein [bacterium]
MDQLGFIRHAPKVEGGKARRPLAESGLSFSDQLLWEETVAMLGIKDDPGITYESLPLIKKMAEQIYEELPEKALAIFTSTTYPRTRMTSALLQVELMRLIKEGEKEIGVASAVEPSVEEAAQPDSRSNLLNMKNESAGNQRLMRELKDREYPDDQEFEAYLQSGANTTFARENEMLRAAVNEDLASGSNSFYRKRLGLLREQLRKVKDAFTKINGNDPVYFYAVGHHPNLITLDVALNGRAEYQDGEIQQPLTVVKADREKLEKFLEEKS